MNIIKCDNCNSEINQEIETKKIGDIEIKYLYCNECCAEYIISVTDSKLMEMIKNEHRIKEKIKLLDISSNAKYKLCTSEKQKNRVLKQVNKSQNKLMKEYHELKQAIKEHHEQLKARYEAIET